MLREAMMADTVEGGKGAETLGDGVFGSPGWTGPLGGNHEIFRGVLGGDEFKDLGFIAGPFEELGAEGVGGEFGLALLENAVAQRIGEHGRRRELWAELFLTAR